MYNDSTIRPHVEAVRQADTYFRKGQHDMAAHKLYATQGALEQAIKKNIETGGECSLDAAELYVYLSTLLQLVLSDGKRRQEIEPLFDHVYQFFASLPESKYIRQANCHMCVMHAFYVMYHPDYAEDVVLEKLEKTRGLILESAQKEDLADSLMWANFLAEAAVFLVEAAAYVRKRRLVKPRHLLNLYEEAVLFIEEYTFCSNINDHYRALGTRRKAYFGQATCYLSLGKMKEWVHTMLRTLEVLLMEIAIFPVRCAARFVFQR